MPAGIIDAHMDLTEQLEHAATTAGRLRTRPLTSPLAAPFMELCTQDFPLVREKEAQLCQEAARCEGLAWYANLSLIDLIGRLDKAQLRAVNQKRKHERYAFFFGKKRPYQIKRLSLGGKLELLATWVEPVQTSPFAEVAALGPVLEQLLADAKGAEDARKASAAQVAQFCTIGDGAAFTAKLNAVRKATLGKLAEMPHKLIGEGLPSNFADEFFLPVDPRPVKKAKTEAEYASEIAQKEQEIADLKADLEELRKKNASEAMERAKAAEEDAAVAVAQKDADDAVARAKALAADSRKRKLARQKQQRRSRK